MADPTEGIAGISLHRVTEGTVSCSSSVATLDAGNTEKIELVNKGPNSVYFRTDGTTPTAGAAGNGDIIGLNGSATFEKGRVTSVKLICSATETATVFYRLYS